MKKRMSKLFLTVAMVITLMSVMSVTAAAEDYDLYVGGVQVTDDNKGDLVAAINHAANSTIAGGSATFEPTSNTLTLDNFTYAGAGHECQLWSDTCCAAIYANDTLRVVLKGENTIAAAGQDSGKYYSGIVINGSQHDLTIVKADDTGNLTVRGNYCGIYAKGAVTISGSSTVTVNATSASNYAYGIYAGDNVTISGGEVTVNATSASSYAYGIYAGSNVTISGSSTVTVDATSESGDVYGIYAYGTFGSDSVAISDSSKVAVTVEGSGAAKGIYAQKGKITISGSEVDVTAEGSQFVNGICANNGDIAVSNSSEVDVTARGTSDVYGIYADGNGSVDISGGTVNATSTGTAISSRYNITIENTQVTATGSCGIDARDGYITISNSTVSTKGASTGIDASGNVEISGSSTVTTMDARTGIDASGNITISGSSTVTATSTATGSNAVYGIRSKTVAISDNSTVTVNATSESGKAYGIYAGGGNTDNAAVDISGNSKVTVNATSEGVYVYGIYTKSTNTTRGNVKISENSTVTVNATAKGSTSAYGIYTESEANSQCSNNSNVTISDSTVTVDASAASGSAYGIYTKNNSDSESGNVTISGSKVTVNATTEGSSSAYGIRAYNSNDGDKSGNVTISGGDVNVTAKGSSSAYGIYADSGNVTISGGDVNVTAEGSSSSAYGVYGKNVTISGGDVNVTAKGSSSAYGIYAKSGSITISNNGAVTASGDSKAMNRAPDVSQVAAGYIITASENANGSDPVTYNASSINSYKYIEIGPAIPTYAITSETATNGTVTVDKNSAKAGATVTITATPDDGYEVDTITVTKDGGGSAVEVTNNTFTMPDYDVTISVTFRKLEILEQPAAGNDYTVTASGTPTYQWYKVIESEDGFLVTEEFLNKGNGIAEGHGTYDSTTGNWTAAGPYLYGYFMIYMNSGDTLTVTFSNVLENDPFMPGCNLGTPADVTTEDDRTYVFTAPYGAGGAKTRDIYMLLFMPSGEVPTMRAVYKGSALEAIDQTNAALDTDGLASGTYVCRVTWVPGSPENYSGIYTLSEPVEYTAPAPAPAPKPAPSGGSSSSGSSSAITSKTEKNEDGSSTTTTTNRITGTVTETTKNTDGTTGTTVTDKSGNITAVSATVPAAAASAAEKTGKPVTVPVEVPVAKRSEDALPIKVEIPTGGVTVEIPVENVTPGTVVVIVAKDGTEQVVRTSSVSETGVVVNLAQDATVKVVDMSHNFVDVHPVNHWAADAIDFVAARGIFNGTSTDTFTPNGSMTRQAMWMTLARMSGEEPADMAAARDWAMENEVSDGSRPLETVTRQQYVTMLWRWAAAEGMDVSAGEETNILSFTDADKISDYAVEAFRWACGEGIVDGYNDDTLRAMTNASRAHAAAMMMRFCAGMVN